MAEDQTRPSSSGQQRTGRPSGPTAERRSPPAAGSDGRRTDGNGRPDDRRAAEGRPRDSASGEGRRPEGGHDRSDQPRRPLDAAGAARLALDALKTLTNRPAEGVVGAERLDDGGWVVVVELLETSRVPSTSDVLGEYEVEIGPGRDLRAYARRARYLRGSTQQPDGRTG